MIDQVNTKLEKIKDKLDEYGPSSRSQIIEWEKKVKKAMEVLSLEQTKAIQLIIEKYKKDEEDINYMLTNDEKMTEAERVWCFKKKAWIKDFLSLFENAHSDVESVTKAIDNELN